jgi:threonine/homoserine/homoserine lactone efflux protein
MPLGLHDLLYTLGLTAFVSLSGVMMPGPVFAAAVAKGYEDRLAGVWIALGHGVVEFPLMALLFLGFAYLAESSIVTVVVSVVGGAVLIYLGASTIVRRGEDQASGPMPHHPVILGAVTTASNPYWLLWWLTIGLALMFLVYPFAFFGFLAFALVHWSCDLGWNGFVSATVHKTRRFWSEEMRRAISILLGVFLLVIGAWFVYSAAF